MSKIRVFIKKPGEDPFETNISDDLDTLQSYVDGYVQKVKLCEDFAILCDEDGKLKDKELNFMLGRHRFVGTVVFVGIKDGDFADVPCTYETFKRLFCELFTKK